MEVRPSPGRVDTLVGRAAECAALTDAVTAAGGGRPVVVLVTGEAGIGKTRLADECAAVARAAGMRVVCGAADPSLRAPMELWRGVFHALKAPLASDPSLPAEERRWEQLETSAEALAAAAPVVVLLDDLHWADAMAIWVLEQLPRALGDAAVAVGATTREHEPEMPRLNGLQRVARPIRLEGLDVEDPHWVDRARRILHADRPDQSGEQR